jgi:hypothetical protein
MKLTVQLKLQPTPQQATALRRTLEIANAACDYISQVAFSTQTFRQFAIHKLTYQAVRETFGLAAQLSFQTDCCEGRMHEAGDCAGRVDAHSHADEGSTVAARNTPLVGLRSTAWLY